MNDNETYGVQLDLLTQNYNKKLQDVVNTTQTQAKLIEQKAKVNFDGYSPFNSVNTFAMGVQTDIIKGDQTQIENILSDLKVGKIDTTQARNSINELLNDIKVTNEAFRNYTNTRIKINVDDSELVLLQQAGVNTQLIDKYVQVTNQDLDKATDSTDKLGNSLGKASNEARKLNQNTTNANRGANELGQNLEKNMNKGAGSTTKLLFSLFSVQSVWGLISRASNNAMSNNDEINSKVNVLNSALGNIMLPVVQKIVGYAEYGVIFVGKVVQFFTGIPVFANLTTTSLKNATKQAKELTKTLAGFDEITNIGQSSKGSLAGGIKNDLQALDDFYKKIEEVENWMNKSGIYGFLDKVKTGLGYVWEAIQPLWDYVLWPMLDFALQNPWVLTTLFSIFLGTKLKNGIADVLGSGGTGLVGVHSILGKIAMVAGTGIVITIAVKKMIETINTINETSDAIDNMATTTEKGAEANRIFNETTLNARKGSDEFNAGLVITKSNFKENNDKIDGLIKSLEDMSSWEKTIDTILLGNNSTYAVNNREIKNNADAIIDNIKHTKDLIDSRKMSTEEENEFIESVKQSIEKMEIQKGHLSENSEGYKGLQSAINVAKETLWQYEDALIEDIKRLEAENTQLDKNSDQYKKNEEAIQNAKGKLDALKSGNYDTVATIDLKANTSKASNTLKNFFGKLANGPSALMGAVGFNNLGSWLNSFDVGTNYVPNDQLAMVHKGEMIVPAKYNPSTSGISGGHDAEIISAIEHLTEVLEEKDMNVNISEDYIGSAASNYKSRRSRQLGKDVG